MSPHLFGFQRQLNEDLLEFFIDKVDAELLEAVASEDLKSVDVENSHVDDFLVFPHSFVDRLETKDTHIFT